MISKMVYAALRPLTTARCRCQLFASVSVRSYVLKDSIWSPFTRQAASLYIDKPGSRLWRSVLAGQLALAVV